MDITALNQRMALGGFLSPVTIDLLRGAGVELPPPPQGQQPPHQLYRELREKRPIAPVPAGTAAAATDDAVAARRGDAANGVAEGGSPLGLELSSVSVRPRRRASPSSSGTHDDAAAPSSCVSAHSLVEAVVWRCITCWSGSSAAEASGESDVKLGMLHLLFLSRGGSKCII